MNLNPWAVVILLVGLSLMVAGFKGSQDNLVAAITGKPYKNSTLASNQSSANGTGGGFSTGGGLGGGGGGASASSYLLPSASVQWT